MNQALGVAQVWDWAFETAKGQDCEEEKIFNCLETPFKLLVIFCFLPKNPQTPFSLPLWQFWNEKPVS